MTKQIEVLKLLLESAANYIDKLGGDSRKYRQALAQYALDKKAENARELGLDYEPIVERVEDAVGMGHNAWDMVKPTELAKAFHEALAQHPAIKQDLTPEQPAQDNTYEYAKNLADAIFKRNFASDEHYASGRIVWGVNDTVIGILTQINNMVSDMVRGSAQHEPVKLWLWKNFVNGRPEYWAFDNAFPININDGDPQTIGEPCGYAWLKPSRQGRFDVSDEEVLRAVQNAKEYPSF